LNDPSSLFFLRETPDASRVLLFVAALGDIMNSIKQSSPLDINKYPKNNNIGKE